MTLSLEQFGLTAEDYQSLERMRNMFNVLDVMTNSVIANKINGMVVYGPPGLGKTFTVERELNENANMPLSVGNPFMDTYKKVSDNRFRVISGYMKPVHLYRTLYEQRHKGITTVFDDCDSVLRDANSINLLKAALDTGEKRDVSYNSEANMLRKENIPYSFTYEGGCIFITNIDFTQEIAMQEHLAAILSRCHYIDLSIKTDRDKFLWMLDVVINSRMLEDQGYTDEESLDILKFIQNNIKDIRELSLRMVLKIAKTMRIAPEEWRNLAKVTCMV